ncbi:MAG: hypothetical protein QGF78_06930 [Candidatus Bathyarchaeota archaeon]|jgi:hypothetical protein|nr:hypothetical protein [Candidatus Bathyarchaeota archaeon]
MVEGRVRRCWKVVAGASGEGSRVGREGSKPGFEGGFEAVLSSVQH